MKVIKLIICIVIMSILAIACNSSTKSKSLDLDELYDAKIKFPASETEVCSGSTITFSTYIDEIDRVSRVDFCINDEIVEQLLLSPFELTWRFADDEGTFNVQATIIYDTGFTMKTNVVTINITSESALIEDMIPANNSTVSKNIKLTWSCNNPNAYFKLHLGKGDSLPVVEEVLLDTTYSPMNLESNSTYSWKVIAINGESSNESPVYRFNTQENALPKFIHFSPAIDADTLGRHVNLEWEVEDLDNDELRFDVYFGQTHNMNRIASDITETTKHVYNLSIETDYTWKIVARDSIDQVTSEIMHFRTQENIPPEAPILYNPENGSNDIHVNDIEFTWSCNELQGETLRYNLFLEKNNIEEMLAESILDTSYSVSNLDYATTYNWRVEAKDSKHTVTSETWSFTTNPISAYVPVNPVPENNSIDVFFPPTTFSWETNVLNSYGLTFSFYIGTNENVELLSQGLVDNSYTILDLEANTTYYWKVVSTDGVVDYESETWSFTTND